MSAMSSDAKQLLMLEAERLGYVRPVMTKGGHLLWVHAGTRQRVITGARLQGRALRNARVAPARRGPRNAEWECICVCARRTVVRSDVLIQGRTRSCGCLNNRLSSERRRGRPFGGRLPAAIAPDDWRRVLRQPASLAEAEATHRELIRAAHPDAGGTQAAAAALNAAIAQARRIML